MKRAVVVVVLALAGCSTPAAPPAPEPTTPPARLVVEETPAVQRDVHPGAFCSPPGARGVTANGIKMRCMATATDDRERWRR
jgi:hypothetical protein